MMMIIILIISYDCCCSYLSQSLPFGGVGRAGSGRFAGIEGLRGVCYAHSVVEVCCLLWFVSVLF